LPCSTTSAPAAQLKLPLIVLPAGSIQLHVKKLANHMKILVFLNALTLGGTEKAAGYWAASLSQRGHVVSVISLTDGPRRAQFELAGLPVQIVDNSPAAITHALNENQPDVIHVHAPGYPHSGDILGVALKHLPKKIPVVQTNVFGRLNNPAENAWTDFRLFISWTSCVQAARRAWRPLDAEFFRRASAAVYPLDSLDPAATSEVAAFRRQHGVTAQEVLFGRLSRPEPNKWTDLALHAFQRALKKNPKIKLLLREPPSLVAQKLRASPEADRYLILPATADPAELRLTLSAIDVVLHTSLIGESFGYGIAEPMNLGKPVITHSVPWGDQAQIELVREGECGFVASAPVIMAQKILQLAENSDLWQRLGNQARQHIRTIANPEVSLQRLESILQAAISGTDNPFAAEDLAQAQATGAYLDAHQFGHSWPEQLALRPFHYRVRFHEFRKRVR
jgi:glycosyltransferase involved in cell wall biosynthesis